MIISFVCFIVFVYGTYMATKYTIIPNYKETGKLSLVLLSRLFIRATLALLSFSMFVAVYNIIFTPIIPVPIARLGITISWMLLLITFLWYWKNNPLGAKGL